MSSCAEVRRARPLLGTIVEITAVDADERVLERGIARAFSAIAIVQRLMSYHEPTSDVGRLNDAPVGEVVQVHPWTHLVVRRAQQLAAETGGTFDITVAPHLAMLGYLPRLGPAAQRETQATFRDLEVLSGSRLRARRPLRIDLGGIAKGFAVDRAIAALRGAGVADALVNAGGDLRSIGLRAWPISIRHPARPEETAATIALQNAALATSATYFTRRSRRGRWVSPLLDGVSRRPVGALASASVLAPTCLFADALTKTVMASTDYPATLLARHHARALLLDGPALPANLQADAA